MGFLRRVFGRTGPDEPAETRPDEPPDEAPDDGAGPAPTTIVTEPADVPRAVLATCPSCGYPLDPPPQRDRRCPSCRERIVVRHVDGRLVHLTEGAVVVFDRERRRIADEARWSGERERWLSLASSVDPSAPRIRLLADAPLSDDVVTASRELYVAAADRAVRADKKAKRWNDVARLRREEAAALFVAAGNPIPPPADIAAFHREGMLAELRALAVTFKDVELVGARCCRPCRTGDGKAFRIADELRTPRLPHEGCPKGLCGCEWWLAMPGPKSRRRTRSTTKPAPDRAPVGDDAPGESLVEA